MEDLNTINGQLETLISYLKSIKELEGSDQVLDQIDEDHFNRLRSDVLYTYKYLRHRNGKEVSIK